MLIDLHTVRPGRTLRIPFSTFDKDDGSTITMTNYAVADILIFKDGSTTERASTSGFTATTDFDAKTGKHLLIIDLADNTTADFFQAGSEYLIGIDAVTVDAVTVGGWVARFVIGYQGAIIDTTIATLSSQTSFTLTSGPAENDALKGMMVIIHDAASAVQLSQGLITAYTGATKTVTLAAAPSFTVAAADNISIFAVPQSLPAAPPDDPNGVITRTAFEARTLPAAGYAPAATALSKLQWTDPRAALLDNLNNLDAAITSLNNLSALANLYGSPLLEIPDAGTTQFAFTLVVRDNEGKLKDLDANPTITAANAGGTNRSANLSAISHPSTGRYTFTYGVSSAAAEESLRITCSGAIGADARYVEWIGAVVNYDTLTTLAATKSAVDSIVSKLPANSMTDSDKLLAYVQLLARSDLALSTDRATELAEINGDEGSGTGNYFPFQEALQVLQGMGTNILAVLNDTGGVDGVKLASQYDLYSADIQLTVDEAHGRDEYTVTWLKNGVRLSAGITAPTIQVVKRSDGTDLITSQAMSQIGATGSYKFDEATNRVTGGEAVLVLVGATIDGGARSFPRLVARDSAA